MIKTIAVRIKKIHFFLKNYFREFLPEWIRSFLKVIFNFLGFIVFIVLIVNPILSPFGCEVNIKRLLKKQYFVSDLPKQVTKITEKQAIEINLPVVPTQEYPSSQGYSYQQSINLVMKPAVIPFKEKEQPFWFGLSNIRQTNYRNPTLFLNFHGKVNVRVDPIDSGGWVETDPNFSYFIKLEGDMQPLVTYRLNPLFIKFPKEGDYKVSFGIRGDNEPPIDSEFLIKARTE